MTDQQTIDSLKTLCKFEYIMKGDRCTYVSFHDPNECLGGTIRRHPLKREILRTVSRLEWLEVLDLRKCKTGTLPAFASRSLEHIDLSCNDLEHMPSWVMDQPNLRELNLGANRLTRVPPLDHLPLTSLKLHKNLLTDVPPPPLSVKNLNLYLNRMDKFPTWLGDMTGLEVFSFGLSRVADMGVIASLPRLRWLTLAVTQIIAVPDAVADLTDLVGMQLAKNAVASLPDRIGGMKLEFLTLYGNKVTSLPESFFSLPIRKLNLSRNPLNQRDRERAKSVFGNIEYLSL